MALVRTSFSPLHGLRLPSAAMEFQLNETWYGGLMDDFWVDPEIIQKAKSRLQAYLPSKLRTLRSIPCWQKEAIMPFMEIPQRVIDCAWLDAAYFVLGRPAYRSAKPIESSINRFGSFFLMSKYQDVFTIKELSTLEMLGNDEERDSVDANDFDAPSEMQLGPLDMLDDPEGRNPVDGNYFDAP